MSFLFSPVGIITYFMIRDDRPKNAKAYLGISLSAIALTVGYGIYYGIKWNAAKKQVQNSNTQEPTPRPYTR